MNRANSTNYKTDTPACFHCGLAADSQFSSAISGITQQFCCIGCQAVACAIADGGLSDFYRYRDAELTKPETSEQRYDAFDLESVQREFVTDTDGAKKVSLLIGGISCAACAWLIEHYLEQIDGVSQVRVNVSTHFCLLIWQPDAIALSKIFSALARIGYRPIPGTQKRAQIEREREKRQALIRIGIAGLGMMQVGMVAIALHAGSVQGIDASMQHFLRWVSLFFAVPVVCFSAQPFFLSAWRALRMRHLNMDVSVSLAIALAFVASIFGTLSNTGEVYFDSVSMFTFFLLVGRQLEMRARHKSVHATEKLAELLPISVELVEADGAHALVPLSSVNLGDDIYIGAGDVIPCDGELLGKFATVDESLLTGESEPVEKTQGALLYAGSVCSEPAFSMRVTALAENTQLASVTSLLLSAQTQKPKQQQIADKVASKFVLAVLCIFSAVFIYWYVVDPARAFWIALSVLVVTCPCALSLATPAALASGLNCLRRLGFLIMSARALEVLPKVNTILFDKTGTLTVGKLRLSEVKLITDVDQDNLLSMLAAIERYSRHPIAAAFEYIQTSTTAEAVKSFPGQGIRGHVDGFDICFGKPDFVLAGQYTQSGTEYKSQFSYPGKGLWQLVSVNDEPVAWLKFADQARENLAVTLEEFTSNSTVLGVLSGDRQDNVDGFLIDNQLQSHFSFAHGGLLPEQKLHNLQQLQAQRRVVMMVGDGINDVPVLGAADISVAMGDSSRLTQVSADAVLLNQNISTLRKACLFSSKVQRVIRQNLLWALAYNVCALPAAAAGLIPPYVAALGMSLSSLVVVLNSLRLHRLR